MHRDAHKLSTEIVEKIPLPKFMETPCLRHRLRGRRTDLCNAKIHAVSRLRRSEYLRGPLSLRRSEMFFYEQGCNPAQHDGVNASCQHESLFRFVVLVPERTVIAWSATGTLS
jgi:hypothetical protein